MVRRSMNPSLLTQSSLFGMGIAFSPLHIGVVTLLLLGSHFSISLAHGEREQVLIDLLGAGALLALGLYQLTPQALIGEEGMALQLLPPLAWIGSSGTIREPIARLEDWLQHRAEWLVGVLALVFAAYLLYEGLHGLEMMQAAG